MHKFSFPTIFIIISCAQINNTSITISYLKLTIFWSKKEESKYSLTIFHDLFIYTLIPL